MDRILEYYFNPKVLALAFPDVLAGFRVTVLVSLLIIVFGIAVGLALALLRSANFAILNAVIIAYIDVLRTLPQLVVIVFIYFGLPSGSRYLRSSPPCCLWAWCSQLLVPRFSGPP
jgi:His/Glu/Gln/Arg/opine family amino acid ABC transporter permease subunit